MHYGRYSASRWPESYVYRHLKSNAKRRGIPFSITLAEFKVWLDENPDYIWARGREGSCLSVDRCDNSLGYALGNLRLVTQSWNSTRAVATTRFS